MSDATQPEGRSFASRVRRSETNGRSSPPRIVEEENDFPFDRIDFVRIGSAHNACKSEHQERNSDLLQRIVTYVMSRYEPDRLPSTIEIEQR
jgi:hypothetical protein